MLGSGRISFETPNVIDPGDIVPATPARSLQKDFENRGRTRISPPDEFRQGIYKPALSRTIKIDYQDDADDEPTDLLMPVNLDPEYGETKEEAVSPAGSPTMEDTRLFAAAMLSESERRGSRHSIGIGAPVKNLFASKRSRDEEYLRNNLGLEYPMDTWRKKRKRRCRNTIFLVLFVVVLFVVFGVLIGIHGETANAAIDRLGATSQFLIDNKIATKEDLSSVNSPQYRAAEWIANKDEEFLDIPTDRQDDPFRFIQRYVLAVLYYSLGGESWTASLKLLSSDHECSWNDLIPDENKEIFAVGVSCDQNLNVNSLLIPSNNLKGVIPDEIRHLKNIKFISLKHNEVSGNIPSALEELKMLEYFDVKVNNMDGTIPEFVGELTRLQVLGLSKNNFVGSLPRTLGTLRLKTLAIDDNNLTGDLSAIRLMSPLQYLYAQNNYFNGNLFHGILMAELPSLVEVDLSGNELTATEIPSHVFALPKLKLFDASGNQVAGKFPDAIPENDSLEYLSFRGNAIDSSIPESISNLKKLTHLDLEQNSLTGSLPASITQMSTLAYLFLGKNSIATTSIPGELKELVELKELSLNGIGLQGEIPDWIAGLTNLNLLDLRGNELSGAIEVDFSRLQSLKYLMLSDNKLTGTVPAPLGTITSLQVLSLYHNNLTGSANPICNGVGEIAWLATDCDASITCDCCDKCCSGENCYPDSTWDTFENFEWDQHHARAEYAFNPNILKGGIQPRGGQA